MKSSIVVLLVITLFGCNKSNEDGVSGNVVNNGIEFSVFNSQNEDLLDPATANHLSASEIKLFYEIDGKIVEIYNPNYDQPRNYLIFKHEYEYRIGINLNDTKDTTINYIQWNNNDTDTIRAAYELINNKIAYLNKVWLNGKQIWKFGENGRDYGYYTIIKNYK